MKKSRQLAGFSAGLIFLLLLLATAVASRTLLSSSSSSTSEDNHSSSDGGTVLLSFTATLPSAARRRSLFDRPASTCGEAAFPKDAEVEDVHTWLFRLADFLSLPRTACTAMGLQIIAGAKSFTVFCLGNSGQLSAFSAGDVAGATVSTGIILTMLDGYYDITFDAGSKVILEANLKTRPAPGLPNAIVDCDALLVVEAAAAVPDGGLRRHLLTDPTDSDLSVITPIIDGVLNDLSDASGIPRSRWTATNAQMGLDADGITVVLFIIFVRAPPSQATALVDNWDDIVEVTFALGTASFGSTFATVPDNEFPDVTIQLSASLEQKLSDSLMKLVDEVGAGIGVLSDFTGTPSPNVALT